MKTFNFLLIPNHIKKDTIYFTNQLLEFLINKKQNVFLLSESLNYIHNQNATILAHDKLSSIDFAIVLGGDGTVLRSVRRLQRFDIPILGVNFGHLGYLTECEPSDAFDCITKVINGEYRIEERILLEGELRRANVVLEQFIGLNETVIYRGSLSRALCIRLDINEKYIETFSADGILIATPTGSTAYNLSAGGPILTPASNNFAITPICSHSMPRCSVVASGDDRIDITINPSQICDDEETGPLLTVDSCEKYVLQEGDCIHLQKAQNTIKIVKIKNDSFYITLRQKLAVK